MSSSVAAPLRVVYSPLIRPLRGRLGIIASLAFFVGLVQAVLLGAVVQIGLAASDGRGELTVSLGPLGTIEITLGVALAGTLSLVALVLALDAINAAMSATLTAGVLADTQKSLFAAFTRAEWSLQAEERDGHLQTLVMTSASNAANGMLLVTVGLASATSFVAMAVAALAVNVAASFAVLGALALLYIFLRPIVRMTRRSEQQVTIENLELANVITRGVNLAQEITTFNVGRQLRNGYNRTVDRVALLVRRRTFLARLTPSLFRNLGLASALGAMSLVFALELTELGSLATVLLILLRAITYGQALQSTIQQLHQLAPHVELVLERQESYRSAARPVGHAHVDHLGPIRFDKVSFTYPDGRPALADVSFETRPGEAIGVIGPSAAGKSTLIQLLLRLREPTSGTILVGGRKTGEIAAADWYDRVAFVPQEPRTFEGSVSDNVRFFRDLSDVQVREALSLARVLEEIEEWNEGLDTPVGERGGRISGGQRQRLVLARALAVRPDLLILDEPTSALDVRSETAVRDTLEALRGETTLIVVTHRMSTLEFCDRLMVFDDGHLVAFDTPQALAELDGFFREALGVDNTQT